MASLTAECIKADLLDPLHGEAVIRLLDMYASDPYGGGEPLSEYAKLNLITELSKRSSCHVFLARLGDTFVGIAICFEAFSTFSCKPILNIHDFAIDPAFRGRKLSSILLQGVEKLARELGCCKITLEVLENNIAAKSAYVSYGFNQYVLNPEFGGAVFFQKFLSSK